MIVSHQFFVFYLLVIISITLAAPSGDSKILDGWIGFSAHSLLMTNDEFDLYLAETYNDCIRIAEEHRKEIAEFFLRGSECRIPKFIAYNEGVELIKKQRQHDPNSWNIFAKGYYVVEPMGEFVSESAYNEGVLNFGYQIHVKIPDGDNGHLYHGIKLAEAYEYRLAFRGEAFPH